MYLRGHGAAHLLAVVFFVREGCALGAVFRRIKRKAFLVFDFSDVDEEGLAGGPAHAAEGVAEVDGAVDGACTRRE